MMKPATWFFGFLALAVFSLSGCGSNSPNSPVGPVHPDKYSLSLQLSGMTPVLGEVMQFRVFDQNNQALVYISNAAKIDSASFTMDFGKVYEQDHYFQVDFYADHNGNGKYDTPPTDRAWRLEIGPASTSEVLHFQYNTNFSDAPF